MFIDPGAKVLDKGSASPQENELAEDLPSLLRPYEGFEIEEVEDEGLANKVLEKVRRWLKRYIELMPSTLPYK